jgi:hypothetical protein
MYNVRRRFTLLALGIFASITIFGAPTGSLAATCSGYACDNQNPQTAGCAADAFTAVSKAITYPGGQIGLLELRVSRSCGTKWGRVTSYQGPSTIDVRVESIDGRSIGGTVTNTTQAYSFMLYGPTTPMRACGTLQQMYDGGVWGTCTSYY